jgi:hypothetical protein
MCACLLNHHDTLKSLADLALSSGKHYVTSETKSRGWRGGDKYLVFKFFEGTNKQANRDREEDNEGKHTL